MDAEDLRSTSGSPRSPGVSTSNGSVSSVTSPSSFETSRSPRSTTGSSCFSGEASSFFSDVSNYLALGTLCFEDLVEPEDDQDLSQWQDITQLPPLLAFEPSLSSNLQRLAAAGWIRVLTKRSASNPRLVIFRVYILPFDVGLRFIDRQSKRLYLALEGLAAELNVSEEAWAGDFVPEKVRKFDTWASSDEGSLFWMFNKLPSPSPRVNLVKEKYAREALEDLLDPASLPPGLKTPLYPYQRRSAGLMLQRESVSALQLDPRLEKRIAPDGFSTFYYGARDLAFLRHPRYYEACKGGVLAETMGLGKTVICLATILATKDHLPKVPPQFAVPPVRSRVASLADMAISAIGRKSVPWRVEFERIKLATGDSMDSCRERLHQTPAAYDIPLEPVRWNRKTVQPEPKRVILASTTIIVVPRNLCKQWQSEIRKHVDENVLRILVMDDAKRPLPCPDELRSYDIVLFTRGRFEIEIRDGADDQGRRLGATTRVCQCTYKGASRTRDCHCLRPDELYDSPLKHLHFKRLIIDEGHFFSNTNNAAVSVANRLITVDHRWVVSGTPAKDLLGVEVDVSTAENLWHTPNTKGSRDAVLEQRRYFNMKDDTSGAIKSLGSLASSFLEIKPWCAPDSGERKAEWEEYIYRHEDPRKRTYSGFSTCLRRTLEGMVVKTQPEDVEKDIELPPLSHEVIRLEPSFYDKLTANMFNLVLTANAVTSERSDMDYLFHKASAKARSQLISNLRQSAFFWTGFSEADVEASLKSSDAYLAKDGTGCTEADRKLLTETLTIGDVVLASAGWKSLSRSNELGVFVEEWPDESAEHWAFDHSQHPLLTGLSQLLEAQNHVNERAEQHDPAEGLAGLGIRALVPARYGVQAKEENAKQIVEKPILTKSGIPASSIDGEPVLRRRASSVYKGSKGSPKKSPKQNKVVKPQKKQSRSKRVIEFESTDCLLAPSPSTSTNRDGKSTTIPAHSLEEEGIELPADSPLVRSRMVGTTSAKLSYLISQILKHYEQEKILVFYDGDNVAYYIAQMLELLHIKHEIYAKSLAANLKSEYVVRFDQEAQDRVLLMDVRNAAFGLNLPSASRIYFVNPVCRPNVEAQAIKRAHRIGQTRKVFVETLVLKGTIEEKMLERSRRMTRAEHYDAKALEDDGGIREIIQSAKTLPVAEREKGGYAQMAALEEPQQLWGRSGWRPSTTDNVSGRPTAHKRRKSASHLPDAEDLDRDDGAQSAKKVKRRTLSYVDCTNGGSRNRSALDDRLIPDSEDEPMLDLWRRRSSTTTAAQTALLAVTTTDENPHLLSLPPPSGGDNKACNGGVLHPNSKDAESLQGSIPKPTYRQLPISQLLNHDQKPLTTFPHASPELLQEILRRL